MQKTTTKPKKRRKRAKVKTTRGVGRPTRKTNEIVEILLSCIRSGFHIETACGYAKINKQTFYNWLDKDKDFSTQVDFAKSESVMRLAQRVAEEDPWKILKNIAPRLYRDKIEQEISGKDGSPLTLVVKDYRETPEEK